MKPVKVTHLTSVHSAFDTRIFHKECKTLRANGYNVTLVAPHAENCTADGVQIIAVKKAAGRVTRMTRTLFAVCKKAFAQHADVYHFHDPELMIVGFVLKAFGKKVVYDVHEDVPRQIMGKSWIPEWLRYITASMAQVLEGLAGRCFDRVVAATPHIASRFPRNKTVVVQNFPILSEFELTTTGEMDQRRSQAVYSGGISIIRGIREMVEAMALLPDSLQARLLLAGAFQPPQLELQVESLPGWERVDYVGWQSRSGVATAYAQSCVGLVTLHPNPNYLESYPVKMFEYMAAGLPVIASDFPLWRRIVDEAECGILVDPLNPHAVATAIEWIMKHETEAKAMGERGRHAVLSRYNWDIEARKLLVLYEGIGSVG